MTSGHMPSWLWIAFLWTGFAGTDLVLSFASVRPQLVGRLGEGGLPRSLLTSGIQLPARRRRRQGRGTAPWPLLASRPVCCAPSQRREVGRLLVGTTARELHPSYRLEE